MTDLRKMGECIFCGYRMSQGAFTCNAFSDRCEKSPTGNHTYNVLVGAAPSEGIKPGLLGVLLKAVDDGEANWRKGGCLENGCACWTEHVKEAIRAALSPAQSGEPPRQLRPYKDGDAKQWFDNYCYENAINFAARIEVGKETERLDEFIPKLLEAFLYHFFPPPGPAIPLRPLR